MHILLIEPDKILANAYSRALTARGHTVMVSSSAQSAIFGADERRPDAVILELQLTGHSGIEFLYEFRSYGEWQSIPVLVHTQVPTGEFAGSWQFMQEQLGVTAYLYKPLTSIVALQRSVEELAARPA